MPPRLFNHDDEIEIARLYLQEGWSTPELASKYNTNHRTILNVLDRRRVKRRPILDALRLQAYRLDRLAFRRPLTSAAEYWTGFLMADGCVTDQGALLLRLQLRDEDHVRKFRRFMHAQAPIYYERKTRAVGIAICSREVCGDLMDLGVTPRKSLVGICDPDLTDSAAFWRGMIDGDGHIGPNILHLVGGQIMLEQWCNFARLIGRAPRMRRRSGNLFQASCHGDTMRELLGILYMGSEKALRLERKYNAASNHWRLQ
jgi:hypothetical protein